MIVVDMKESRVSGNEMERRGQERREDDERDYEWGQSSISKRRVGGQVSAMK